MSSVAGKIHAIAITSSLISKSWYSGTDGRSNNFR